MLAPPALARSLFPPSPEATTAGRLLAPLWRSHVVASNAGPLPGPARHLACHGSFDAVVSEHHPRFSRPATAYGPVLSPHGQAGCGDVAGYFQKYGSRGLW